jgi:large subunit ribosomal protein L9
MLVILRENVENLGRIGDVVNVSDGYARNFLMPRNLVTVADEKNVAAIENQKKLLAKKAAAQKSTAETLAKKVAEYSCTISRKVGEKDEKIFGSVTSADVADVLKNAGYEIDKRMIQIDAPIKTLGVHPVTVKLQPDVVTTLKVWVVKEE